MSQIEDRPDLEDQAAERTVADIEPSDKYEFLQMVRQGLNRQEAAHALGFKGRHFRALCSPSSSYYDEEFKVAYDEGLGSLEHAESRLERLRAEAQRRALVDSDRLLEKLLMVHDPDWAVLRQKDVNVNVHAVIQQQLKLLPTPLLEQVLAALEDDAEIEEAQILELPRKVEGQ